MINPLLKIKSAQATIGGFEVFNYTGDDGYPAAAVFDAVVVTTVDGREFTLPRGERRVDPEEGAVYYRARYDLAAMLDRVVARGAINPALWVELEPAPSIEQRFADAYLAEQQDRWGV